MLRRDTGLGGPAGGEGDATAGLNAEQRRAATAGTGPLLILAGAGTGKTRTLVHRVAWLVEQGHAPESILLLSFTRRAADEMLRRAAALGSGRCARVVGGTFHSFANAVLREHGARVGLGRTFTILDEGDAEDVLGLLRAEAGYASRERRFPRKQTIRRMYSRAINCVLPLGEVIARDYLHFLDVEDDLVRLFEAYQRYKLEHQLVDYDDLLLWLKALLVREPDVRRVLSERHRWLLVDEYQDTNRIQADLVRLLAETHENVTVVGDDAQSIYSFRGAEVRNVHEFPDRFPGAHVVALEENYRSTQPILDVANAVLAESAFALEKRLRTSRTHGERPALVRARDEREQSSFVVQRVLELREEGVPLERMAVLFRSSFHAYDLEVALAAAGIPFVKRGGFKLMETAHVRDVLAHLRAARNPRDRPAWHRVLALVPGMGPARTTELVRAVGEPGADAVACLRGFARGGSRVRPALDALAEVLAVAAQPSVEPARAIERIVHAYAPSLRERFDDWPKRERDLEHLTVIAERHSAVEELLAELALDPPDHSVARAEASDAEDERLVLSTIHSAKGLEWHAVFVLWVLDGRFPSFQALGDEAQIEEERRLLYVALTRAEHLLYLCYPVSVADRSSGQILSEPSRFLWHISGDLLEPMSLVLDEAPVPPRALTP